MHQGFDCIGIPGMCGAGYHVGATRGIFCARLLNGSTTVLRPAPAAALEASFSGVSTALAGVSGDGSAAWGPRSARRLAAVTGAVDESSSLISAILTRY